MCVGTAFLIECDCSRLQDLRWEIGLPWHPAGGPVYVRTLVVSESGNCFVSGIGRISEQLK